MLDKSCANILISVLKLDSLCNSDTILSDFGAAICLLYDDISALHIAYVESIAVMTLGMLSCAVKLNFVAP